MRSVLVLAGILSLALAIVGWLVLGRKASEPVPSNATTSTQRAELERRAAAGDPAAQYALTLFLDAPEERAALLRKAASAGYPPAAVTLASELTGSGEGATEAKLILERAARGGYYPAITALAECAEQGQCGTASVETAASWTIVSRLLEERKLIPTNELLPMEKKLRLVLTPLQWQAAESEARALVGAMRQVEAGSVKTK